MVRRLRPVFTKTCPGPGSWVPGSCAHGVRGGSNGPWYPRGGSARQTGRHAAACGGLTPRGRGGRVVPPRRPRRQRRSLLVLPSGISRARCWLDSAGGATPRVSKCSCRRPNTQAPPPAAMSHHRLVPIGTAKCRFGFVVALSHLRAPMKCARQPDTKHVPMSPPCLFPLLWAVRVMSGCATRPVVALGCGRTARIAKSIHTHLLLLPLWLLLCT